jgi:hypothetical protein
MKHFGPCLTSVVCDKQQTSSPGQLGGYHVFVLVSVTPPPSLLGMANASLSRPDDGDVPGEGSGCE